MGGPLTKPETLAIVGDWHGNTHWALNSIDYIAECQADVIIHLGDFGYRFNEKFLSKLGDALRRVKIPLLFIDGNHEDFSYLYSLPVSRKYGLRRVYGDIWHIPRGKRWEWDGVRFMGLGGAHSVDKPDRVPGAEWWPDETLTMRDVNKAVKGGYVDVMFTHDCPSGVEIPGLAATEKWFDPAEIAAAKEHQWILRHEVVAKVQPALIYHGHFHKKYTDKVDFGYGPVLINGLDMDSSTLQKNIMIVDLIDIKDAVSVDRF